MPVAQELVEKRQSREAYWLIAVVAVAIAIYVPTFRYMAEKWRDEAQYSLGFLAPPICAFFVWQKWSAARSLKRSPSSWGLALMVLGLLMHLAGTILDVSGPSALSLIPLVAGGCMYFHSTTLARVMWFALAFMIFMIPIPGGVIDRVGLPMQLLASGATAAILHLFHIDVSRAGIQLTVDGYSMQVAQACSGMSSLVALVGVTAVFAHMSRLRPMYKWTMFALALPIALAANIIRITSISLAGITMGWEKAMSVWHEWSSPMLFLVAILLLFAINWGFEWLGARQTTS